MHLTSSTELLLQRLHNQKLLGPKCGLPAEVVAHLGAVQSQDYSAAKWALGKRLAESTDAAVEAAYNAGQILRTHILRPTWHFVTPIDIRWMQTLTAHRVQTLNGAMYRKLELDEATLRRAHEIFQEVLRDSQYQTREELGDALERSGIPARGQRLAYIVMHAELSAVLCSGPRRGKQFTYALLEERAPQAVELDHDAALARLAQVYFTSHGPAQLKDFVWWSGLTVKEAQAGIDLAGTVLERMTLGEKTYWSAPGGVFESPSVAIADLMSIFDEYTIAYRDRSDINDERFIEQLLSKGNDLTAVVMVNGQVAGTWKRTLKKKTVALSLDLFRELHSSEERALAGAIEAYAYFLELDVELAD